MSLKNNGKDAPSMGSNQITYQQLDALLLRLRFIRDRMEPKWLRYSHADSGTQIILVENKPTEFVRASDAWSAREHLLQNGLLSEDEFSDFLKNGAMPQKAT